MTEIPGLAAVDAALAGRAPLPRDNGELVFEEPWQARALGMGVVALERTGTTWAEFRQHLVAAIERHPGGPDDSPATAYYSAWIEALEGLLAERGLIPWPSASAAGRTRGGRGRPVGHTERW